MRPSALGNEVTVETKEQADLVLAEISWIEEERAKIAAATKQKIEAIKTDGENREIFKIDEKETTYAKRLEYLESVLSPWVLKNAKSFLVGKKKTYDMPHGTIGLRQQPLVVEFKDKKDEAKVLAAIDKLTDDTATTIMQWGIRKLKNVALCFVKDLLTIEVSVNLKGIKDALENGRIERKDVEKLGLVVRDAKDDAVIKPAKVVVQAES